MERGPGCRRAVGRIDANSDRVAQVKRVRILEGGCSTWSRSWTLTMKLERNPITVITNARDLLGGNRILLCNHVIRHMADIEAIPTFEGTETIQPLIVGRDITGVGAF
jgi:glutaryl-CoA dehydrogenase